MKTEQPHYDFDYVVIGSGFGGSVSALRLAEKGYRVLVLEKGQWKTPKDFAKNIWDLKRWMWLPAMRFFGIFKLTYFRHVAVLSGVGVGGGSLVYANTLPVPKKKFYTAKSWAHLADWEKELADFYPLALRMLGATPNPVLQTGDLALKKLGENLGLADKFQPTNVAVYFGKANETVEDPYFDGKGPERTGCNFCGGCMVGCRYNAKNTLDKNYLHLAQQLGVKIQAESEVVNVVPLDEGEGESGYRIDWQQSTRLFKKKGSVTSRGVIFSGGVLGTVKLLLKLKDKSLPFLSDRVGANIRTNSESLISITTLKRDKVLSKGVAIGSILHTDEDSHLEPVRYNAGSGFWRLMGLPMVRGRTTIKRVGSMFYDFARHPVKNIKVYFTDDWAKRTQIMLFMQTIDSTLRFTKGIFGMKSKMEDGDPPTSFIPEAFELADKYSEIIEGKPYVLATEAAMGIPTTAHILGGAVMGKNRGEGVIDSQNRVFGYRNMYVCDGSMISANPGVNPSLTITAISERAMSKIPEKNPKAVATFNSEEAPVL